MRKLILELVEVKSNYTKPILTTVFCVLFIVSAKCQQPMTAEKVVNRFIELSGGENYLNSLKSLSATAKGVINGDSIVVNILKVFPDKLYTKYVSPHDGIIEVTYNRGRMQIKKDGQVLPFVDSLQLEYYEINSFVLPDMAYKKLGYEVKLLSSEEDSTNKVEITSPKGIITYKYYSKKSGYLTKMVNYEGLRYFFNYQTTDKFTIHRREKMQLKTGGNEDVRIVDVTINPVYDSSIFNF